MDNVDNVGIDRWWYSINLIPIGIPTTQEGEQMKEKRLKDITLGQVGTALAEYYTSVCLLIPPVVILLLVAEAIFK